MKEVPASTSRPQLLYQRLNLLYIVTGHLLLLAAVFRTGRSFSDDKFSSSETSQNSDPSVAVPGTGRIFARGVPGRSREVHRNSQLSRRTLLRKLTKIVPDLRNSLRSRRKPRWLRPRPLAWSAKSLGYLYRSSGWRPPQADLAVFTECVYPAMVAIARSPSPDP